MVQRDFDFLVFIGRFQPYHNGHHTVVTEALRRASFLVLLLGSAHRPRCTRNPWTFAEREAMVLQLYFVEEMNLEEIGLTLGIGAARVCQIKKAALDKVRGLLSDWD